MFVRKAFTLLLVLAVALSLCANVYAADDVVEVVRTPTPVTATYKDNSGNTWGFILYCTGAGKTATVDTYFQLEKVYDSSPDTWDDVAGTSKVVTNSSAVGTLEGGSDSKYCGGSKTFYVAKGDLLSQYTYLSTVTSVVATHKFDYAYEGVPSSYSRMTTFSFGEQIASH